MERQQWIIKYLMSSPHVGVSVSFVHGLPFKEGTNSSQPPSIIGIMVFSRRNCDPSRFAMTTPGSSYHVSQAISHNPGNLWGAGAGEGRGALELEATNNWPEESCLCIWLFIIRHPLMSTDRVGKSPGLPEERGPQRAVAVLVWPGTWPTMIWIGCRDPPNDISYFCLWWLLLLLCCLPRLAEGL